MITFYQQYGIFNIWKSIDQNEKVTFGFYYNGTKYEYETLMQVYTQINKMTQGKNR